MAVGDLVRDIESCSELSGNVFYTVWREKIEPCRFFGVFVTLLVFLYNSVRFKHLNYNVLFVLPCTYSPANWKLEGMHNLTNN